MATDKNVNADKIKEHLLSDEGPDKIVVLFSDSLTKGRQSKSLGEEIKADPKVSINRNVPFRVQNNLLTLGVRHVVLGLKDDEKFLIGHYSEGIIWYYEDAEDS